MRVGGRVFFVTFHALMRWRERCTSAGIGDARRELRRVMAQEATVATAVPEWAVSRLGVVGRADEYVLVKSCRALFPVRSGRLTTCIAPSRVTGEVRWS